MAIKMYGFSFVFYYFLNYIISIEFTQMLSRMCQVSKIPASLPPNNHFDFTDNVTKNSPRSD